MKGETALVWATIALAVATFVLAFFTYQIVRATRSDLKAQWRPVLIPSGQGVPGSQHASKPAVVSGQSILLTITNAGRGPALFVRALLDPLNASPEHWDLGAIEPGQDVHMKFNVVPPEGAMQLLLDYRDLADRLYSSALVIHQVGGELRFYDVRLFEGEALTPHGDALSQPGLKELPQSKGR